MSDNKYIEYANGADKADEGRGRRHKRRVRSRIISIISLLLILSAIVIGGIYAVNYVSMIIKARTVREAPPTVSEEISSVSEEEEMDRIIESLLSNEEENRTDEVMEPELTEEEIIEKEISDTIKDMTVEDMAAALFIVSPEAVTGVELAVVAGDGTRSALSERAVGGIIYSKDNILSEDQFKLMVENTKAFSKYQVFTCLKEGFGSDSVINGLLGYEKTKSAEEIVDSMDPYTGYLEAETVGKRLKELGIDMTFGIDGISKDISFDEEGKPQEGSDTGLLGNDPVIAGQMISQIAAGFSSQNILMCVGTLPNDGTVSSESENALLQSQVTQKEFEENAFHIYESALLSGAGALVVGHVYDPLLTRDLIPVSMSESFISSYLRKDKGFEDVLIITDVLDNDNLLSEYSEADVCINAINAGVDMLLCPRDFDKAYEAVLDAMKTGKIDMDKVKASLRRIFLLKYRKTQEPVENGESDS